MQGIVPDELVYFTYWNCICLKNMKKYAFVSCTFILVALCEAYSTYEFWRKTKTLSIPDQFQLQWKLRDDTVTTEFFFSRWFNHSCNLRQQSTYYYSYNSVKPCIMLPFFIIIIIRVDLNHIIVHFPNKFTNQTRVRLFYLFGAYFWTLAGYARLSKIKCKKN